jgi:hypothetical protein
VCVVVPYQQTGKKKAGSLLPKAQKPKTGLLKNMIDQQ